MNEGEPDEAGEATGDGISVGVGLPRGPDVPSAAGARHSLFAAAGAIAIGLQVVLLRELIVALGGDESAVGIGLAAWLAGVASGAAVARRWSGRDPRAWAAAGILLLAIAGPVQIVAGRLLRLALAPPPGELLPLGSSLLLGIATLFPSGCLVGATFTALAAAAAASGVPAGRGISRLYIFESLGSLAAGIAVTFLLVPFLPPLRATAILSGAGLLLAIPATTARTGSGRSFLPARPLVVALSAALLIFAAAPWAADWVEERSLRARFAGMAPGIPLIAWVDSPYQHAAVGGDSDVRHLYAAGQYAGSFPDPVTAEGLAHTIATLAPRPARVLAIGGVLLGPLRFLLRHPVERVDIPEPDPRTLDLLRGQIGKEDAAALSDPRVVIARDDPRRFLARSRERYGLIAVIEPDPITLLLARLTTVEFYRLCAEHLAPDGVLVVTLRTAPSVITGETAAMAGSIYGALMRVFPVVHAGPGPDGLLVAGSDPSSVTLDPGILSARWRARGIAAEAFAPEMFPLLFPEETVRSQEEALRGAAATVAPSTDERPVSFLHALARRQTITGGMAGRALSLLARIPRPVLAVLPLVPSLLVLVIISLRKRSRIARAGDDVPQENGAIDGGARRDIPSSARQRTLLPLAAVHAVTVTGACGIVWSLLLLFSYQTSAGALYGRLGVLTALFMLGLALGGAIAARAASASIDRARSWLLGTSTLALAFGAALSFALPSLGRIEAGGDALTGSVYGALLLLAGLATGSVFPASVGALLASGLDAREAAGSIETADHAGAAAAALFAAVLFVPAFGLTSTALILCALQAAAVGIVGMAGGGGRRDAAAASPGSR